MPIFLNGVECVLLESFPDHLVIDSGPCTLDSTCSLEQKQWWIQPREIAGRLNSFWNPIWQRDKDSFDIDEDLACLHSLVDSLPPHQEVPVNMQDISLWTKAIKELKSNSARGIDHVSSSELKLLPSPALLSLAEVMDQYSTGYPDWFMVGIVRPLAKTPDTPNESQTRPITVLPQLYRVWCKVIYIQVSTYINSWLPPGVSGLLPHRGVSDAAYASQFTVESARSAGVPRSGMCLDLVKCFNMLKFSYGFQAMKIFGVPVKILQQWILSLGKLLRFWLLDGSIYEAGATFTGFPEGDTMSVLVMITLAGFWVCMTQSLVPESAQLSISAYADNWAWSLIEPSLHSEVVTNTIVLTDVAGVLVDFRKTWFWATRNDHAALISDQLVPIAGQRIKRVTSAADLGHQMQYSGQQLLGITQQRIDTSLSRVQRLQVMPHDLVTKSRMISSSILPSLLFGSELRPISDAVLTKIRSKTARALVGPSHAMSPSVVLLMNPAALLDPEFCMILQAIKAARRFLMRCSCLQKQCFLSIASKFNGNLKDVRGPATALGYMLNLIDWRISKTGVLQVSAFEFFDFTQVSCKRLTRFLISTWQEDHVMMHTNRTSAFHCGHLDRTNTIMVLKQFSQSDQTQLLREIGWGFQLQTQKEKWCDDADGCCSFCTQPDSRRHRLLECPIGDDARLSFAKLVEDLEGTQFPEFPFMVEHPMASWHRTLHFRHAHPEVAESLRLRIVHLKQQGILIHWSTDGSCAFPSFPSCRFSAFSIMIDTCPDDQTRVQQADLFVTHSGVVTGWQPMLVSRTQGEQDILRAELEAICYIVIHFQWGVIHTDSQACIDMINKVRQADQVCRFQQMEHFDLLLQIWSHRHAPWSLHKVKAHVELATIHDPLQRYWHIGNVLADAAANSACHHLLPDFVGSLTQQAKETQLNQELLAGVFQLHLQLQQARIIAEQTSGDIQQPLHTKENLFNAFANWEVNATWVFPEDADSSFLSFCQYGHQNAIDMFQWLSDCRWEETTEGPLNTITGISWVEMAVSWILTFQRFLPVVREVKPGVKQLVTPGSVQSAVTWGVTLGELGYSFGNLFDSVIALTPQAIVPSFKRNRAKSLYMLGCWKLGRGPSFRPKIPSQAKTIAALLRIFAKNSKATSEDTPDLEVNGSADVFGETSYDKASTRARNKMAHVRQLRTAMTEG
eukprot:Skav214848  [mRNA]  locus=scaffold16:148008:151571:+ [translate_table: standard]